MLALAPLATEFDPDTYGGAVLLGVNGVCVISHGSSGRRAILNAVKVAHQAAADKLVARIEAVIASGRDRRLTRPQSAPGPSGILRAVPLETIGAGRALGASRYSSWYEAHSRTSLKSARTA